MMRFFFIRLVLVDCIYIEQSKHNAVIIGVMKYTFGIIIINNHTCWKNMFCIIAVWKRRKYLILYFFANMLLNKQVFILKTPILSWILNFKVLSTYRRVVFREIFIMCGFDFCLTWKDFFGYLYIYAKNVKSRQQKKSKMLPNE